MPYVWSSLDASPAGTGPVAELRLWPHHSLAAGGFVAFIAITSAMIGLPLLAVMGSPVLWGLLPFLVAAIAGIWWALRRNDADREIVERMVLAPTTVTLERTGPRGRRQAWEANPHWIRVEVHPNGGPVPHYITLRGGPREVELGAFLAEEERLRLAGEVREALAQLR